MRGRVEEDRRKLVAGNKGRFMDGYCLLLDAMEEVVGS